MSWVCMCPHELKDSVPLCADCLHERPQVIAHESVPMYREFPERQRVSAGPDDRCPECGKTTRQHIEEFSRVVRRIGKGPDPTC